MHQSPLEQLKFIQVVNPADLGDGATNGAAVDLQGWDGVVFVMPVGNLTDTLDMKAQESSDNNVGDPWADVASAALTQIPAATGDNKFYALDVWRNSERYVRPVVTVGGGGANALVGVLAVLYRRTGTLPFTQDATLGELVKLAVN